MKIKNKMLILFFSAFLVYGSGLAQTSHDLGVNIEISEDAVNDYLLEQYNSLGFVSTISGEFLTIDYEIIFYLPKAKFLDDQANIQFGFDINTEIDSFTYFFDDGLTILPGITNVRAISEGFADWVNNDLDLSWLNNGALEAFLKSEILAAWDGLELEMYPRELAEEVSDFDWLNQRSINIVDPYFSLGWDFDPGYLKLTLITHVESQQPNFIVCLIYDDGSEHLWVCSNIQTIVKGFHIFDVSANCIASGYPNEEIPKRENFDPPFTASDYTKFDLNMGAFAPGNYYVWIYFEIDETFYIRKHHLYVGGHDCDADAYERIN